AAAAENRNYEDLDEWPETCQNGTLQSPITIIKASSISTNYTDMEFYNYYNTTVMLESSGYTVELKKISEEEEKEVSSVPRVTGGPLGSEYYQFDSFHFHKDAEHTIDGYRYPMEGHFVHYNSKYDNLTNAVNYVHGFSVFSVQYEIQDTCANSSFADIIEKLKEVTENENTLEELTSSVDIYDLLPSDLSKFFVYTGSFTTPNCTEGALWVVFEEPVCLERSQLEELGDIYITIGNQSLLNYNRPLQEVNEREILYSGTSHAVKVKNYLPATVIVLCLIYRHLYPVHI
ncbi:hypothetical protein NQ318_021270, partial [Aromia moschata]